MNPLDALLGLKAWITWCGSGYDSQGVGAKDGAVSFPEQDFLQLRFQEP